MSSEEFVAHLWQAHKDKKWIYKYGYAQYRQTDCVGLYKMIMEWYYDPESVDVLTLITSGDKNKIGKHFNQVSDLIKFGIVDGEDGLYDVCPCCDDVPTGAAVFCYRTESEGNKKFDKNEGWTHVGFYIGYGIVVEASSEDNKVSISSIYDGKWDYYGLLRGICY